MKDPAATPSRATRLEIFQQYEFQLDAELAQNAGKSFKYHLNRLTDQGRWVYVVLADNTEVPYSKKQMALYRSAEEWVEHGGKCPFTLTTAMSLTLAKAASAASAKARSTATVRVRGGDSEEEGEGVRI